MSETLQLNILNICATKGVTPAEAYKIAAGNKPKQAEAPKVETVATPADEKRELAKQIEALNGTVPHHRSSVAKYEQALIAAKED